MQMAFVRRSFDMCAVARRACGKQPRVAAQRLPWVPDGEHVTNPEGVSQGHDGMRNPCGVESLVAGTSPRVAAAPQPWAVLFQALRATIRPCSTEKTMNPRERILTALDHRRPDRTPVDGWFHPEVVETLKAHFHTDDWSDVLAELGIEGWIDLAPWIHFADFEARATPRPGDPDGRRAVWLDADTYEDPWCTRFRLGEGGRYERWLAGPLEDVQTPDDVARYPFPTPEDVREPEGYAELASRS